MARKVKITAVYKQEPDVGLYVLALIALARQIQEEEQREQQSRNGQQPAADAEGADD